MRRPTRMSEVNDPPSGGFTAGGQFAVKLAVKSKFT